MRVRPGDANKFLYHRDPIFIIDLCLFVSFRIEVRGGTLKNCWCLMFFIEDDQSADVFVTGTNEG